MLKRLLAAFLVLGLSTAGMVGAGEEPASAGDPIYTVSYTTVCWDGHCSSTSEHHQWLASWCRTGDYGVRYDFSGIWSGFTMIYLGQYFDGSRWNRTYAIYQWWDGRSPANGATYVADVSRRC